MTRNFRPPNLGERYVEGLAEVNLTGRVVNPCFLPPPDLPGVDWLGRGLCCVRVVLPNDAYGQMRPLVMVWQTGAAPEARRRGKQRKVGGPRCTVIADTTIAADGSSFREKGVPLLAQKLLSQSIRRALEHGTSSRTERL